MSDVSIDTVLAQMRALSESARSPDTNAASAADETTAAGQVNFSSLLEDSLARVNDLQSEAKAMKAGFETGSSEASLPEVMIAVQKASVSFEAVTQVRNKLLSAYQEIMNMQV